VAGGGAGVGVDGVVLPEPLLELLSDPLLHPTNEKTITAAKSSANILFNSLASFFLTSLIFTKKRETHF